MGFSIRIVSSNQKYQILMTEEIKFRRYINIGVFQKMKIHDYVLSGLMYVRAGSFMNYSDVIWRAS